MPGPLHVVLLASVPFPPAEGVGVYVLSLARRLVEDGGRVTILTRGGGRSAVLMREGRLQVIGLPFAPVYPVHVQAHGFFVRRALRLLDPAPDVIHAHSPLPPDPGATRVPLLTTLHSGLRWDAQNTRVSDRHALLSRLQTPIAARTEAALVRRSSIVSVVDPSLTSYVAEIDPSAVVEVVLNAVDVEAITPGPDNREPLVACVGRLAPAKGVEDLLDAWRDVTVSAPASRLVIVGDGPLRATLESRAGRLGILRSVTFIGSMGAERRPQLIEIFRRAAVVVQPSHHEGLSTVVLEAMAAATPVIATAVGAHPTVIASGKDGLLIPPRHPAMMAERITSLLIDTTTAREIGRQGRQTVIERYSWRALAARHKALYLRALGGEDRR